MANDQDIAFVREVLRTVFGLDKQAIDNVIREIRSTTGISQIKTSMIRQRIGAHSLRLLRNGINAAKEASNQPDEEDEDEDEFGEQPQNDMRSSAEDEDAKQQNKNRSTGAGLETPGAAAPVRAESTKRKTKGRKLNESNSRGEFDILKEFLVDIDPNDEDELIRVRRMIMQAQQPGGEERLMRQLVQRTNDERDQGRRNGKNPVDTVDQQIDRLKHQIALLQHRKAALKRREQEGKEQGTRKQQHQEQR